MKKNQPGLTLSEGKATFRGKENLQRERKGVLKTSYQPSCYSSKKAVGLFSEVKNLRKYNPHEFA